MDIRWLQDFLSIAEAGNFRAAAESRHSSQPAFSRRIQALEVWLGAELIDRSRYPTVLTPAGERFRPHAVELVRKVMDSRSEVQGEPASDSQQITFALPQTLATSRFPSWWTEWQQITGTESSRLIAANVHDAVTAFVAGMADVLIFFHHAQQPVLLNAEHYDRVQIGIEWMRPYCAASRGKPLYRLPGRSGAPLPLLSYSPGAFLGRMADLILQSAPEPLHAKPGFESDLADALLGMTIAGHGVAWLPECTAESAVRSGAIRSIRDDRWALPMTIFAYRDRARLRPAVNRLMAHLEHSAPHSGKPERNRTQLADVAR